MIYVICKTDESDESILFDCIKAFSDKEQALEVTRELNKKTDKISVYYGIKEVPLN